MIADLELLQYAQRGLIAGPNETEEEFLARCHAPLNASQMNLDRIKTLFSITPDWIDVNFSNKGLLPWQGGAVTFDGVATLQVRMNCKQKNTLYGIYPRDEIIAHELVHMTRMTFNEPLFEEILAYQTSNSKFRCYFGPIFNSSKESIFFVALLPTLAIVNLLYSLPLSTFIAATGFFTLLLYRLWKSQTIFSKTLSQLAEVFNCKKKALSLTIGLTDQEIIKFSTSTPSEIFHYANEEAQKHLRWRQLWLTFFNN